MKYNKDIYSRTPGAPRLCRVHLWEGPTVKYTRLIAFLLALILAVPLLAACGGGGDTPPAVGTDTPVPVSDTAAPETEPEPAWPDNLPSDLDFDGAEFRTAEQPGEWASFWREEEIGERFNDALYARNRAAEERLGVRIVRPAPLTDVDAMYSSLVMSGSDEFDVMIDLVAGAYYPLIRDQLLDWSEIPYMDFSQPWYEQDAVAATLNGRIFYVIGDVTPTYLGYTYLLLFNKDKAEDYHVEEDLYQLVRDGKWTLDRMLAVTENLYNDLNGNGNEDEDDFYGITAHPDSGTFGYRITAFMYACETPHIRLTQRGSTVEIETLLFEERALGLLEKLSYLLNDASGAYLNKTSDLRFFSEGRALFIEAMANDITADSVVGMEDDFGVLPLPKFDEKQAEYRTTVDYYVRTCVLLKTVTRKALIGAVMETLSSLSWRDVTPAYAEAVLELRSTRDAGSAEMLRLIFASRTMDFNLMYATFDGWPRRMDDAVTLPETTVSWFTSQRDRVEDHYYQTIDYLLGYTG